MIASFFNRVNTHGYSNINYIHCGVAKRYLLIYTSKPRIIKPTTDLNTVFILFQKEQPIKKPTHDLTEISNNQQNNELTMMLPIFVISRPHIQLVSINLTTNNSIIKKTSMD